MKGLLKKVISSTLVFMFIFNVILPITVNKYNQSEAWGSSYTSLRGLKNILEDKYYDKSFWSLDVQGITYKNINDIEIYVDEHAIQTGRANMQNSKSLLLYDGSSIVIRKRDSDSLDYYTTVYVKGSTGYLKELGTFQGDQPITFTKSMLEDAERDVGSNPCYLFQVKERTFGIEKCLNRDMISVPLMSNRIRIKNNNPGYANGGLICENAFFDDDCLYLRPFTDVLLSSIDVKGGQESLKLENLGPDIACSGNTIRTAENSVGFVLYECDGSSTRFLVRASNLAGRQLYFTRGKVEYLQGKTYNINGEDYPFRKTLGVKNNQNTVFKVKHMPVDTKCKPYYSKLEIKDLTGCLATSPNVSVGEDEYTVTLKAKKNGYVSARFKKYDNTYETEVWYLNICDNTTVENPVIPKFESEINPNSGNNNYNDYYEDVDTYYEMPTIYPQAYGGVDSEEGNTIVYKGKVEDGWDLMYLPVRRRNPNVPANVYGRYDWWYYVEENDTDPSEGAFKITLNRPDYPDGVYDLLLTCCNETGQFVWILETFNLGPSNSLKYPSFSSNGIGVFNEETGGMTYNLESKDCSEVKYKVIKRSNPDQKYDEGILSSYDDFDGTIVSNPAKFDISIQPNNIGSGYYDIVIFGKNANSNTYVTGSTAIERVFINSAPQTTITKTSEENVKSRAKYKLEAISTDKDKVENNYYYVHKKDSSGKASLPTVDQMKSMSMIGEGDFGGKFNSGDEIEISQETNGAGFYDLIVYAEDEYGAGKWECVQNILIAEDPKLECKILGEANNNSCSVASRFVQTAEISVIDELADKYDIEYCYTPDDITEGGTKAIDFDTFRNNNKYKITKLEDVNSKTPFNVDLEATAGKDESVYLYVLATPKHELKNRAKVLRTGSIRLNGTPLEINTITANKELKDGEKVGYKKGETLDISLEFNHEIDPNVNANLFINVGNTTIKQNSIKVENDIVTFSYNIEGEHENDEISLSRIEYVNNIFSKGTTKNAYSKPLSNANYRDLVSGKYYIDTKAPTIVSMELNVDATAENIWFDNPSNTQFVSNYSKAELVVKYDEEVEGKAEAFFIIKGNRVLLPIMFAKDDEGRKFQDTYDLGMINDNTDIKEFEGNFKFDSFFKNVGSIRDLAGNYIQYNENLDIAYNLNGHSIGNSDLVFDASVYEPELYTKKVRIENDNDTYKTNTEFRAFAEFGTEESCADACGFDYAELYIDYNDPIQIYDVNGNMLEPDSIIQSSEIYDKQAKYELEASQLPLNFKITSNGPNKIKMVKHDLIGNTSSKERVLIVKREVAIIDEESGLLNTDPETMYLLSRVSSSPNGMTKEERTYTLTLDTGGLNPNGFKVYVYDERKNAEGEVQFVDYDNNGTATYKFEIFKGGRYKIIVRNLNGAEIATDYIYINNVYEVGDTNSDGNVDAADVTPILMYIARIERTPQVQYAGDVNNDGSVDVSDAVLLCRYIISDKGVTRSDDGYITSLGNGGN